MTALRWLLAGLYGLSLTAQAYGADAAVSIPFRRVYAPAADPSQWPTGDRRYLPIKAEEFENLVESASAELSGAPRANAGRIASAEFHASWDGERLIGEGALSIEHAETRATLVSLEPCNLALREARWSEPASDAIVGHDSQGRLQLLVERSGNLNFRWAATCDASEASSLLFNLRLPAAVKSRLTLDLPPTIRPEVSAGLLRPVEGADSDSQRWIVDLGGRAQLQLRLVKSDSRSTPHPFAASRQTSTYDLSPRGLELESEILLDAAGESLEAIAFEIDADLKLVAARLNDEPIEWTTGSSGEARTAALRLPKPITGPGNAIRLTAIGVVQREQPWRLPQLRPQGLLWQEGSATVMVTHPLVVRRVEPRGSRQVKLAPLPAPLSGEVFEFQHYSGGAEIELEVGDFEKRCRVLSGVQISVGSFELSGQLTADVRSAEGELFNLRAELQSDWMIESVESSPAEALASWDVVQSNEGRELNVRLAKAVAPKRPLRFKITGRKPSRGDGRARVDELLMLQFKDVSSTPVLLNLQTTEAAELRVSGDQYLRRVDPRHLSTDDQHLFAEPPLGLTVYNSGGPAEVFLVPRRPNYFAEIEIDAAIDKSMIQETCIMRCSPQSGAVEKVVVHFSTKQPETWRFSLAGGQAIPMARLLLESEQRELGLGSAGETWEVPLRTPKSAAFELRASRVVPFESQQVVTLAFLPEASRQRGAVAVRAVGSAPVAIDAGKLVPSPAEVLSATELQTIRGTFRYEPGRDSLAVQPPLKITRNDESSSKGDLQAGAWIWNCHVDSKYSLGEAAIHWATMRIQSVGKFSATCTLPADAELRSVWVNDVPVSATTRKASGKAATFQVNLPDTSSFSSVVIEYSTPQRLPQYTADVSPPVPTVNIAVLSRDWTIWLPPQFDSLGQGSTTSTLGSNISWRQRIFGALGRSVEGTVFRPLSRVTWQRLFDGAGQEVLEIGVAQDFLKRLDAALTDGSASQNWSELLEAATGSRDRRELDLLLDRSALQKIGLQRDSLVLQPTVGEQFPAGTKALQAAGLAVVVQGRMLLLTTAHAVAHHRDELVPLNVGFSYRAHPGMITEEMSRASSGTSSRIVRLARWGEEAAETFPWKSSPVVTAALSELHGWSAHSVQRFSDQPVIEIVNRSGVGTAAWAIFLLVFGIGLLQSTRVRVWIGAATLLGIGALTLPIGWALLLSPALLGVLALLGVKSISLLLPRRRLHEVRQSRGLILAAQTASVAIAIALLGVAAAGQEPEAVRSSGSAVGISTNNPVAPSVTGNPSTKSAGAPPTFVYKVFVPVDEKQKPTDDQLLVDEELYTQLHALARRATASPHSYLTRSSHHRIRLVDDGPRSALRLTELRSQYDIQVLSRNSVVRVRHGDGQLPPSVRSVKLDGQAVQFDRNLARSEIEIRVAEPGTYRIDVDYELAVAEDSEHRGAELLVSRAPLTKLELTTSGQARAIRVFDGTSEHAVAAVSGTARTDVRPTDRVRLEWQGHVPESNEPVAIEAEELLWVTIHPGSMVMDARLKLRAADRKLERIRLAIDPRLRLVSPVAKDSPVRAAQVSSGDPSILELDLAEPEGERATVDLRFMLSAASGIGNIRIPRVEMIGARSIRRQLALTIDSALQYDEPKLTQDEGKQITVADFLTEWGPTENRPQLALTIPPGTPSWVLSARPREPETSSDQLLLVNVGRQRTVVEFRAQLVTEGGQNHQLMVQAPAAFAPSSVSLVAETAQRAKRWSRSNGGVITVFLSSPSSGKQQFVIRGEMPTPSDDQLLVPQFELLGARVGKRQFALFRQPEVIFDPDSLTGLRSLDGVSVDPVVDGGRLVGSFEQPAEDHVLRWLPNELSIAGQLLTTMTRDKEAWYAELDTIVDVGSGVLDTLRFEIPGQWTEPFEITPSATYEVVSQPGSTSRQLIVRPQAPIDKQYQVKIRGRVILGTEDRLQVPEIALQGSTDLRRFVSLPTQFELQQIAWETPFGLRPARLPEAFQQLDRDQSVATYEVLSDRFQAALKSIDRSAGTPAVSLADVHLVWSGRERCHGLITFDLEPVGSSTAVIELPPHCRAISFEVAGLPGRVRELKPSQLELQLGTPNLPQRIKIVFEGDVAEGSARQKRWSFAVPRLVDVPVQKTIWTIYGPAPAGEGRATRSEISATLSALELARLQSIVKLLASAKESAADTSPEEMRRWQTPWEDRLAASQVLLRQLASNERANYADEMKEIEDELSRLGLPGHSEVQLAAAPGWIVSTAADQGSPFTCAVDGVSASIEVAYLDAASDDRLHRWIYALDLLGLAVIAGLASKRLELRRWMIYGLLALAAIAAWQLLAPSWVGLIAAIAVVFFAVRDRQQWSVAI